MITSEITLPDLGGFDTHYGIQVSAIGEDGALIVLGHHDRRRTIAALNRYSRKAFGFTNLLDDKLAPFTDADDVLQPCWAVLVTECDRHDINADTDTDCARCSELNESSWWIRYDASESDTGAFPVMVWEA